MAVEFLQTVGIGYMSVALLLFAVSLCLPKRLVPKIVAGGAVAVLALMPIIGGFRGVEDRKRIEAVDADRAQRAKLIFASRCAGATEMVKQVHIGVRGVLLTKVRPTVGIADESNPMWAGAAFASELSDEGFIRSFIAESWDVTYVDGATKTVRRFESPKLRPRLEFVELVDPRDSKRYRYKMSYVTVKKNSEAPWSRRGALTREIVTTPPPRFAIDFLDLVDIDDRKYWIAGSVIRIVDLSNRQIVAEKTVYVMDEAQGRRDANRSPWTSAGSGRYRCPPLNVDDGEGVSTVTRDFVFRVLIPSIGD